IALDSNNNIYTIGRNFTINLTAFQIDIAPFINAYTSDGQFQRSINPNLNRQGYASRILIDNDNNLYIAGVTNATFSLTDPDNPLIGDAFIAKYDANGQQLWLQTLGSSDADFVAGIALDPSGNIYITGDTQGSLPDNLSQGETDAYLAKFNENGDRLWVKQFGTSSTDNSAGVAIDNAGTIFLAGRTSGSLFGNSPIGQTDGWLAAFNENGEIVTSTYIGTPGEDRINGLVVDASGQIYVTGETAGNLSGPNQGGLDAWIAKYRYGG
ncbi:MAG: SBBP repeat-containing protein, partial [Cyanobacteria bacterium P01_F01_bin.150]